MPSPVKILGIPGSLRRESYNRRLLEAAQTMLPADTTMELASLEGIPVFNQDLEAHLPPKVVEFKSQIRAADAILFGVPEYNYGVAGPLKNAIDWASRPYTDNSWKEKPVAAVSASIGLLGGSRAVYQLRQSFVFLGMHPINLPEVFVTFAPQKFDAQGRFTDPDGRKYLESLLTTLVDWTRRLRGH